MENPFVILREITDYHDEIIAIVRKNEIQSITAGYYEHTNIPCLCVEFRTEHFFSQDPRTSVIQCSQLIELTDSTDVHFSREPLNNYNSRKCTDVELVPDTDLE